MRMWREREREREEREKKEKKGGREKARGRKGTNFLIWENGEPKI